MVMGVEEAVDCIEGMVNVCLNLERRKELSRKKLLEYVKSYKNLIYGEKKRDTKYWFIIMNRGNGEQEIQMRFGEKCYPKKYEIKDKKIWWFSGLRYGLHEEDLFGTYEDAQAELLERLEFEREETNKKIRHLKKKETYFRKEKRVKVKSQCGCER